LHVNLHDPMLAKLNIKNSFLSCRPERNRVATERLAHHDTFAFVANVTFILYATHFTGRVVLNRWNCLWEASPAYLVATCRNSHTNDFVQPFMDVNAPPFIKALLCFGHVSIVASPQHLGHQCTMITLYR